MLCTLLIPVGAISITSSRTKLDKQFKNGVCGDYDYVHFSPVKGEDDNTKYPLFIWLHGLNSGTFARAQLQWYGFSNWASDEYQARFGDVGGCFLLAPRAATSNLNTWESTKCRDLKKIIDTYINENEKNIDKSRIYIAGYSTGGSMVWDMITAYPDFFAAALPLAAITKPDIAGLNKLTDVSLWIFTSDNDPYLINETSDVLPDFEYLAGMSKRPNGLRFTSFSDVYLADGTKKTEDDGKISDKAEHYLWESVTYDMFMEDGVTPYINATTIDSETNGGSLYFRHKGRR